MTLVVLGSAEQVAALRKRASDLTSSVGVEFL